jgi:hypothetical protein
MLLPLILGHRCYLKLTVSYHVNVIERDGNASCIEVVARAGWQAAVTNDAAGKGMKIYLLMLLIGTLLAAIHFTSVPERKREPLKQ